MLSQTQNRWSDGLLKNGVCVAPSRVRSSLIIGDTWLFFRVQGMGVRLFVRGEPVNLASYLVYASPTSAGERPVREYEGVVAGHRFGISWVDADVDVDLVQPGGTAWLGISRYREE